MKPFRSGVLIILGSITQLSVSSRLTGEKKGNYV